MNLFARSWGGILSDAMNARYGMRGRLWSMWVVQALEGMMCIIMGQVTIDMASPDRMLKPGSDDFVRPVYNKDPLVQPQDGMWGMWNTTNPPTGFPYTCEPPRPLRHRHARAETPLTASFAAQVQHGVHLHHQLHQVGVGLSLIHI